MSFNPAQQKERKFFNMAEEGAAQGIDDLLDDIPEAEPQQPEVTPEPEEQPAAEPETTPEPEEQPAEPTEEEAQEAESAVAKLFSGTKEVDHSGETVPVDKHIALRKRAQAAEAEAEALRAQQADVDTSVFNELTELVDSSDDDYVDKTTLKKVVEKLPQGVNNVVKREINKVVQTTTAQNLQNKAKADEATFRKDHEDYDKVTDYAQSRNLVTDAELQDIFRSPNVAEAYYEIAKAKIDQERHILGIAQPSTPSTESKQPPTGQPKVPDDNTPDATPLNDDDGFEAFMDGGQSVDS